MNANEAKRPICQHCLTTDFFDFYVPDPVWEAIVPEKYRNGVLCLTCFDELAARKGINYTLDFLYFAGVQMSFIFQVFSRHDKEGRGVP